MFPQNARKLYPFMGQANIIIFMFMQFLLLLEFKPRLLVYQDVTDITMNIHHIHRLSGEDNSGNENSS